jgi:Ca-activated chloride channel family protein
MPTSIAKSALLGLIVCNCASNLGGQAGNPALYRVDVNLVVFTFSVTDAKGNSVHGLQPSDIGVFEDGIPQKLASFAEGNKPIVHLSSDGQMSAGTNVFILFDTSDRMYRTLPYVCDSIAEFLRHLDPTDAVAIYTFSRNLSRAVPLTYDHHLARAGLAQNVSAGEDTALLNCLLLTLRDAAKTPGRKVVVVFSNGPDDRSMVSPEDVGRVAEDEGIPIYVISTLDVSKEQLMAHTLKRLAERTGGKLYLARNWQAQAHAFASVHDDITSSYTVSYYPAANPNEGFRNIRIGVVSASGKGYRIRARSGYQPRRSAFSRTN